MIRFEDFKRHYKKIIVWGAGNRFKNNYNRDFDVAYLVDSNSSIWGSEIMGITVKKPQEILLESVNDTAVLICSLFENEIYRNARNIGICCDIYTPQMLYPNPFSDTDYWLAPEFIEDTPFVGKFSIEKNVQILIALLKAHNIRKIVASPGGTNFNFLCSIQNDPYFEIYSSCDERSAAYMACGLAAECGEPIALNCTGATASRNYLPGLTEAYYRKLPILAITCSQYLGRIGHNYPQVTDRVNLPTDVAKLSVQLPTIQTAQDKWSCEVCANRALLELTRAGCGPVHINLMTDFYTDCSIRALPAVRVINRICYNDVLPDIRTGRIGIFVGAHTKWSKSLISAVEQFCKRYNAVVICDQTSNYRGEYSVLAPLLLTQEVGLKKPVIFDLIIHIGDITGAYMSIRTKQIWRVNPDGEIRDTFAKLRYIFEMDEEDFFLRYVKEIKNSREWEMAGQMSQAAEWKENYKELYKNIPELPFSNMWLAQKTAHLIPEDSVMYFGILNSLRSWNFFEVPESTVGYANTGGFGIEGGMSSLVGASLADPTKLYFGIFGDLGFFNDMSVLGNRHTGNNLRIMLVNNGAGTEFYSKYSLCIKVFGEDVGKYCAAEGHNGCQSKKLVRDLAENFGFKYMSADNKDEYMDKVNCFVNPQIGERPILFEVFTECDDEAVAREMLQTLEKSLRE